MNIDPMRVLKLSKNGGFDVGGVASMNIDPMRVLKLLTGTRTRRLDDGFNEHRPDEGTETPARKEERYYATELQ